MPRPVARTCCMILGSRYSKASTAEDGLLHPGEKLGTLAALAIASIDAVCAVMQRARRRSNYCRIDCRVYRPESHAPAPGLYETCSCDGNSVHSVPVSASEETAEPARTCLDSGRDKPFGRGNLDSEIPETNGRMAIRGETQHTSGARVPILTRTLVRSCGAKGASPLVNQPFGVLRCAVLLM